MKPAEPVLRDVHLPAAPAWWPPAPGWWVLVGLLGLIALFLFLHQWRRRRRQREWARWFDLAGQAATPAAQVAAMSDLLRRAARRVDPHADRLREEDWLAFLDGGKTAAFSQGDGRLLLDGGYRPQVDAEAVARLRAVARARFLELMAGRR